VALIELNAASAQATRGISPDGPKWHRNELRFQRWRFLVPQAAMNVAPSALNT